MTVALFCERTEQGHVAFFRKKVLHKNPVFMRVSGVVAFFAKKSATRKTQCSCGFQGFCCTLALFFGKVSIFKKYFFKWICEVVKMPTKPVTTRHKAIPLLRRNCRFCEAVPQMPFFRNPVFMRVSAICKISAKKSCEVLELLQSQCSCGFRENLTKIFGVNL